MEQNLKESPLTDVRVELNDATEKGCMVARRWYKSPWFLWRVAGLAGSRKQRNKSRRHHNSKVPQDEMPIQMQ